MSARVPHSYVVKTLPGGSVQIERWAGETLWQRLIIPQADALQLVPCLHDCATEGALPARYVVTNGTRHRDYSYEPRP